MGYNCIVFKYHVNWYPALKYISAQLIGGLNELHGLLRNSAPITVMPHPGGGWGL